MDWYAGTPRSQTPTTTASTNTLASQSRLTDQDATTIPPSSLSGSTALNDDNGDAPPTSVPSGSASGPAENQQQEQEQHGGTTASALSTPAAPVTLEQEITNVMAGFGSFWGKVRKQSVNALAQAEKQIETARKDLTPLVSKARANLDHLGETTRAELTRLTEEASASVATSGQGSVGSKGSAIVIGMDGMPIMLDQIPDVPAQNEAKRDVKGKGVDRGEGGERTSAEVQGQSTTTDASGDATTASSATVPSADAIAASATAFFTKMQTQLVSSPNLQGLSKNLTTLQESVSTNLSSLPTSLQSNMQQLQTHFAHQIDLADTQKTAGVSRFAKEAIQIVPPSESDEAAMSSERQRKRDERLRRAEQVAGGRRETHLMNLRTDPSLLLEDPAQAPIPGVEEGDLSKSIPSADPDPRQAYVRFIQSIEDRGGFEADEFKARIQNEVEEAGEGLEATLRLLVPSRLDAETFWARYFFRVAQIDEDEMRRRQVLQGADSNEDDFSWDMEDEEDEEAADQRRASASPMGPTMTAASRFADTSLPATPRADSGEALTKPTSEPTLSVKSNALLSRASSVSAGSDWGLDSGTMDEADAGDDQGLTPPRHTHSANFVDANKTTSPDLAGPSATSPRASSDGTAGSFDLVGLKSGTPSEGGVEAVEEEATGDVPPNPRTKVPLGEEKKALGEADSDEDSDWE
ncbi:BQ2448_3880 [Microbotryum intermedium]|uniref:BQ2448_3880 protein n=1 Tax=Microbotryum intermedium TaxID=269621 RepID=A0A238FK09_9BASI|nr:BQ2448_3880 [Microbotryum intermedium]